MTKYERLVEAALNVPNGIQPTDKLGHGYLPYYAEFLPDKPQSLLEIGAAYGASALMWNAFFKDRCDLWILDLFKNPDFIGPRWCRKRAFVPLEGDQSDLEFLSTIKKEFSVVIDDGSHAAHHMIISFKHLFTNNLQSGGIYIIEDLATCKETFFRGGYALDFEDTALWMFTNYELTGRMQNAYLSTGEARHYENIIDNVKVIDEKIAFIWKK